MPPGLGLRDELELLLSQQLCLMVQNLLKATLAKSCISQVQLTNLNIITVGISHNLQGS